jgi:hypothetical protein
MASKSASCEPLNPSGIDVEHGLHAVPVLLGDPEQIFPEHEIPAHETKCSDMIRALASTLLNELGWNDKWVEILLAHAEPTNVKAAYNHAKYLTQRRAMM